MNPYSVLGLNQQASTKEIKDAYYKVLRIIKFYNIQMVKKYHPDQNKSPEASEKFKQVKDAYEVYKIDFFLI